ncbi:MAG: hypothetical protein A3I05_03910 [Deltaproteobacteria bacterium RIFCSPLOWO2_02_FULL_44_10]|nr:MAG: hypothetical protein A3I05_03910 [Deltaproteobacteria bacterium RIFCSPLOWO2_02_FULL_44_10]
MKGWSDKRGIIMYDFLRKVAFGIFTFSCILFAPTFLYADSQVLRACEVTDRLAWRDYRFNVLRRTTSNNWYRYEIETCRFSKCTKHSFDETVDRDSPRWPVRLNNLLIVGNEVWLGSSMGIYVFDEEKGWAKHKFSGKLLDISSLTKIQDVVVATRDGTADVCGLYRWNGKDKAWRNIPESRCSPSEGSAVIGQTLFVHGSYLLVAYDSKTWTIREIKLPFTGEVIDSISADGDKLTVMTRKDNFFRGYTYQDVKGGLWSKPFSPNTAQCQ